MSLNENQPAPETVLQRVLENTLSFIRGIAADCIEVSRVPGIERGEQRAWESMGKRCVNFVDKQEELILSSQAGSSTAVRASSENVPTPVPSLSELLDEIERNAKVATTGNYKAVKRMADIDAPALVKALRRTAEALEKSRRSFNEILTIHWGYDGDCGADRLANDGFDVADNALKLTLSEDLNATGGHPLSQDQTSAQLLREPVEQEKDLGTKP